MIGLGTRLLMRILMRKRRDEPSTPLFNKLRILKLPDINQLNTALFVFKSINNLVPSPINYELQARGQYNLRRINQLNVPFARYKQTQRVLHVRGAKLWNELPQTMKQQRTLHSFKFHFKKYLLQSYGQ